MAYDPTKTTGTGHYIFSCIGDNIVQGINRNGVLNGLAVSESSPVGMSVSVASGKAYAGDKFILKTASTTITISSANPTNPRYDIIYLDSAGTLAVSTGTAEANPNPNELPSNSIGLAIVEVLAGATTITNANITDMRFMISEDVLDTRDKTLVNGSGDVDYSGDGWFCGASIVGRVKSYLGNASGSVSITLTIDNGTPITISDSNTDTPSGGVGSDSVAVVYASLHAIRKFKTRLQITFGWSASGTGSYTTSYAKSWYSYWR